MNLYRFLALRLFENKQVSGVPGTLSFFGGGGSSQTLGVPNAWWLTMVAAALMWCYSRYWATGRHWYAIGNDVGAARLAGIRVHRRTIAAYAVTGLFVGLAGVVLIGTGGLVQQNAGNGLELQGDRGRRDRRHQHPRRPGHGARHPARCAARGHGHQRHHAAGLAQRRTELFIGVFILIAVGVDLVRERRRSTR